MAWLGVAWAAVCGFFKRYKKGILGTLVAIVTIVPLLWGWQKSSESRNTREQLSHQTVRAQSAEDLLESERQVVQSLRRQIHLADMLIAQRAKDRARIESERKAAVQRLEQLETNDEVRDWMYRPVPRVIADELHQPTSDGASADQDSAAGADAAPTPDD